MNKTVEDALNELIEFYSITDINDLQYLKKFFVRNLKDVRRRWIKYDKPIREDNLKQNRQIIKAIELLKKSIEYCENDSQCAYDVCNIAINREKEILNILMGSDSNVED